MEHTENYYKAKKRLFSEILDTKGLAIVNNNCKYGKRIEPFVKKKN